MAQPRPWHTADSKPRRAVKKKIAPLIPASYVSVPTQRLIVFGVFVCLQALKLAAIASRGQSRMTMLGYILADVLFVVALPVFSIPWLSYSALLIIGQAVFLIALDFLLFGKGRWVWWILAYIANIFFGPRAKHQSIAGRNFAGVNSHEHLLGKYVVTFLPESSAYMDVLEPLCFHGTSKETVYLHIGLKSTWPSALQLLHAPLGDGPQQEITFTAAELAGFPRSKDELWVPIREPGQYKLVGLTDASSQMAVRIKPAPSSQNDLPIVVPMCPTAALLPIENPTVCAGETIQCTLKVMGLAPLKVLANGEWITLGGPAQSEVHDGWALVDEHIILQKVATAGGAIDFDVREVRDGLGNVVTTKLARQGQAYDLPIAQLREPNKRWPLVDSAVSPEVYVQGADGPYQIGLRLHEGDGELVYFPSSKLSIDQVGAYDLVDVQGQRCRNSASGKFEVFEPPQLWLNVTFAQVEDKCAGPSGTDADLSLSGSPPFRVWYRTIKDKSVIAQEVVEFPQSAGQVRFKPRSVGSYIYEFTAVQDSYRYKELSGPEYLQSQRISELAGATFSHGIKTRYCQGEPVSVDVKLQGRAPLSLKYEVVSPDGSTVVKTVDNEPGNRGVTLDMDVSKSGGNYHMRLLSITDGRGCTTDLGGKRSPDIYVRPGRPSVRFQHPGNYKLTEDAVKEVPLVFTGEGTSPPLKLTYSHDGQVHVIELLEPMILVDKPGVYSLLDLSDSECPGFVDDPDSVVAISTIERPTISIVSGEDSQRCIGAHPATISLALTGEPPFTVWHETADPTGFSVVQNITTDKNTVDMTLEGSTNLAGTWKHYWWITDNNYKTVSKTAESSVAWTESYTNAKPEAVWSHPRRSYEVCSGQESTFKGISVTLRGQPPFRVVVEGTSSNHRRDKWHAEAVLTSNSGGFLHDIVNQAPLGVSKLRLVSVSDGNGCVGTLPSGTEWNQVTLNRRAAAEVVMPSRLDYCVGDRVVVGMKGATPFSLDYKFDGKKQRTVVDSEFSRYASLPGVMELSSVKDAGGCVRDLTNTTSPIVIHQLPSSRITHQTHYNIHHGDKAELWFEFSGEPPFTATVVRSVNGKVKEKQTVEGVMSRKHSVIAEKDGTYEVVALSDKYCRVSI